MAEWRQSTWGDEVFLEYGKSLRDYTNSPGPVRVYGSNGAIGYTNRELSKGPGVILGRKGAYRGVEYSKGPFFVIDTAYYVIPKTELDMRWLYYAIKYHKLGEIDDGSPIPSTTRSAVYVRNLEVPSLEEQCAISAVLEALDNKIEINQRMNNTLEGIAQTLFKSWFVDFDPVKAKAEGRKPEGIDDAIAALFPSRFADSPLGLIPEGWEVKGLDEIAAFLNGLALQKYPAHDPENYLPVIKISQLRSGDIAGADKASTDVPPDYIIRDGDILFSWSGSLEVEIWCGGRGALNQHLFKVSSKDFPKWFYFLWTREHLENFQRIAESKATTMGHIQRKHLSEAKVVCPPVSVIQGVNEIMETMLEKFVQIKLENRNLAYLRDTLLPRLISGKLRVEEVSETVEALAL